MADRPTTDEGSRNAAVAETEQSVPDDEVLREHLEKALERAEDSESRYHLRSALQRLEID